MLCHLTKTDPCTVSNQCAMKMHVSCLAKKYLSASKSVGRNLEEAQVKSATDVLAMAWDLNSIILNVNSTLQQLGRQEKL